MILYLYSNIETNNKRINISCNNEDIELNIWNTFSHYCTIDGYATLSGIRLINNEKTKNAINNIISKYHTEIPSLQTINVFLRKIGDNEVFYIFRGESKLSERRYATYILKQKVIYDKNLHDSIISRCNLLDNYYTFLSYGFDGIKTCIGESDKNKRVCRFCGIYGKENFKENAHAIPDSLGNKLLICYDECDLCNSKLKNIEENFMHLMDIRRALFCIKRKVSSKVPKIVGNNFVIKGNEVGPTIYLKHECIDSSIDITKPFEYRLKHKDCITNEKIYKALVKMVIDLLPADELVHFQNTIKWISSDTIIPDSLPSWLFTVLDSNIMYKQPVIDILINDKGKLGEIPYCTAVLFIYDVAYMYVIPFVDIDKGYFKYDSNLKTYWDAMSCLYPWEWIKQDSYDWHRGYPWCDILIDPSNEMYKILPSSDSVFSEFKKKNFNDYCCEEVTFPEFEVDGIYVEEIIDSKFINKYNGDKLTQEDLIDVTLHIDSPVIEVSTKKNKVTVTIYFKANDTTDKIPYFEYHAKVSFGFELFGKYINVVYDQEEYFESFAFDWKLRDYLISTTLKTVDEAISEERNQTVFSTCINDKLLKNCERILDATVYLVEEYRNNRFIRIESKSVNRSY